MLSELQSWLKPRRRTLGGSNISTHHMCVCVAGKRDAAKLSSLGCQRSDGEAKQAFVRRQGGGGVGAGSGHFLVALYWEVGGGVEAACLLCVAEYMSQSYKLTGD